MVAGELIHMLIHNLARRHHDERPALLPGIPLCAALLVADQVNTEENDDG